MDAFKGLAVGLLIRLQVQSVKFSVVVELKENASCADNPNNLTSH